MRLNLLILIAFSIQAIASEMQYLENIRDLQWQNRIIIVYSDDQQRSDEVARQLRYFKDEIDDRDILWFIHTNNQLVSNAGDSLSSELISNLHQFDARKANTGFSAVLIGKDGGIKKRQRQWNIDQLFALIDTMPMRQREMQEK